MSLPDMMEWAKEHPDRAAIRIADLERENAALREDKERIEWSEKFLHHISEVAPKMDGTRFVGQYRDSAGRENRWMTGTSFRDCIDAARNEQQGIIYDR